MFTRSALVLAFLASIVLGTIALAGPTGPVFPLLAVAAVGAIGIEQVLGPCHAAPADAPVSHGMVGRFVDHAGGIGSAVRRRIQTIPPTKMAAPPGLR